MRHLRLWMVLTATAFVTACACNDHVGHFVVQQVTIHVGESSQLPYNPVESCSFTSRLAGAVPTGTQVVWRTADTAIVALDSLTGIVTGRAVGSAQVTAPGVITTVHVE